MKLKNLLDKLPFDGNKFKISGSVALYAFLATLYPGVFPWPTAVPLEPVAITSLGGALVSWFHKYLTSDAAWPSL